MTHHHERPLNEPSRNNKTGAGADATKRPSHLHAVHALPLADAEPGRLARIALSRLLGTSKAEGLGEVNSLCQALARYAREPLPRPGGTLPPPLPDLQKRPWPHGGGVLRRLGLTGADVRREYELAEHRDGIDAELPGELLEAFFPPEAQAIVAHLIGERPKIAGPRAERSLRTYALEGRTRATKRRPAGPPARTTIDQRRILLRRLMQILVDLQAQGAGAGRLANWTYVPKLKVPHSPPSGWDTSGPDPVEVRAAWSRHIARAEHVLGVSPYGPEAEHAIRSKPDAWLARNSALFVRLRLLILVVFVTVLGLRVGAIAALRRADFVEDHLGPAPDYRRGAALRVRPGKGMHPDAACWKPLPAPVACLIRAYLAFLECHRAAIARRASQAGCPLDPPTLPADYPLLVAARKTLRPWGQSGARNALSGLGPSGQSAGQRPLIVRTRGISDELAPEQRDFVGYPPHAYRHTAAQLAQRAGELWNAEHPPTGTAPRYEPELYATCLLDHTPKGSRMVALYSDHLTPERYELLAGRAVEGNWRLLTTDAGARREPDWDAIAAQHAVVARLERELADIERLTDSLLAQRVTTVDTHTAVLQSAELSRLLRVGTRDRRRAHDRLAAAIRERHALEHDADRWRVLPDEVNAGPRPAIAQPAGDGGLIRDWLTVAELSEVLGVAAGTVYLWLMGQGLQHPRPSRPWSAQAIPAERSRQRSRRIWILGISPAAIPPQSAGDLRAVLSRWPDEKGWLTGGRPGPRCTSRLDLPPAFRAAYRASTSDDLDAFLDRLDGDLDD